MCYFFKNVMKFLRELCRVLTEMLSFLAFGSGKRLIVAVSVTRANAA